MKIEDNCPTIEDCIIEWLHKDLNRIEIFLSVAIEDYISDNNLSELLHTLECIITAKGDTLELVDNSEVDQNSLDKLLRKDVNLSFEQVIAVLGYARFEASGEPVPSF